MCVCVCARARACVRACVRACMRACVCVHGCPYKVFPKGMSLHCCSHDRMGWKVEEKWLANSQQ